MASKALRSPLIRNISKRSYAQAAPACSDAAVELDILPNKMVVAAVPTASPLTRVTVAFKAGSRYEPCSDLGIAHLLRMSAGLSTGNSSGFLINRKLSQIGATVCATGDREFVYYTLEASKEKIQEAIEVLNHMISCQEFRPWELTDNLPRIKYELAALPSQVRAVDLLHRAAYRRNLGNSLFVAPKRADKISSESLQHFASSCLAANRCAITVVGEHLGTANLLGRNLQINAESKMCDEKAVYHSGELRKEMGGELAHIALATQGAPAGSPQALAFAIAAKALGSGPSTKWGYDNSLLSKTIGNIGPFAAAGFNVSYTDNGLFGVVLSVPKDQAKTAVKAAGQLLKGASISSSAIKAGKNLLKLQLLSDSEVGSNLAESVAAQALYSGTVKTPIQLAQAIDSVSEGDVLQALSGVAKVKMSMGAAGNLANVPYVDEI